MSGYRVDHMSHQIETTWDNPDGTPYTRQQAEQRARETKGVWWFDCEMCGPWTGATTNKGTQHE